MIRSIVKSGALAGVSQVVSAVGLLALARVYAPEDFAAWALFVAAVGIVGVIASGRLELAVAIPDGRAEASDLFWGAMGITAIGAAVASVLAALLAVQDSSGNLTGFGPMQSAVLHALGVLAAGGYSLLVGWSVRVRRFGLAAASQLVQASVTLAVQLVLAFTPGPSAIGLVWGFLLGLAAADGFLIVSLAMWRQGPAWASGLAGPVRSVVRFRRFPIYSMPTMLCSVSRDRAAVLLMEGSVSRESIGEYALIQRLASFPVSLVNSAIRPILYQEANRVGTDALQARVMAILRLLLLVTMPWLAITLVLADDLLPWVLGERWAGRGDLLRILVFPAYAAMLVTWMDRLLDSEGRQRLAFAMEAMSMALSLVALAAGLILWGSLRAGLMCQALVLVACSLAYLGVVFRVLGYRLPRPSRTVYVAILMFLAIWLVTEVARRTIGPAPAFALAVVAIAVAGFVIRASLSREWATVRGATP